MSTQMKPHLGIISKIEKDRKRALTPKQKKFLQLVANRPNEKHVALAIEAGYERTTAYTAVKALKDEILEVAEQILVSQTTRAASFLGNVLENDEPIAQGQLKLAAAKEILDRTGVVKPQQVEHSHQHTGGIFLIPSKEPIKDVTNWEEQP